MEKTQQATLSHSSFQCPDTSPSPSVPSSVEFVKVADVKVVAALGDSLTTAVGANATSLLQLPIEYRDLSWSIGGYGTLKDVSTLPNIMKVFNPNLVGASSGTTFHSLRAPIEKTGFNLATNGHRTYQLPSQARTLIDTLSSSKDLNFKEDWKLLTIFIGLNDICNYCKDKTKYSVDNFIHHFTVSLEMLKKEVPRMIVNVVQIGTIQPLREVKLSAGCFLQLSFCSCLLQPTSKSPELQELVKVNEEYQRRLEELLHGSRFFKEDFAVVLQPFLKHTDAPRLPNGKIDLTFFAPDCFHFSMKGQKSLARGLWNNMFQPAGKKTMLRKLSDPISLICPPAEHPYIDTRPMIIKQAKLQQSRGVSPMTSTSMLLLFHTAVAYFLFI
uniref:Phospholipase B1, membrane-associated n=1 Tax=Nothobranchius pienaari TaxID=704102 RepID=A0A1A8N4M9_9TELE